MPIRLSQLISAIFVLIFSFATLGAEKPRLHCVADEWRGYTNADGSGTYWQIIKAVYGEKYQLKLETTPFHRAMKMVTSGKADCIIAIYAKDKRDLLLPQYHIDTEYPAIALFDERHHQFNSKEDLAGLVMVGMKDYGFEHFLPKSVKIYGVDDHKKMYELVKSNRVDAAIVYSYNTLTADPDKKLTQLEIIPDKKYYLGFYPSKLGHQLVKEYDEKLPELILNQTIKNSFVDAADYQHANFIIDKH